MRTGFSFDLMAAAAAACRGAPPPPLRPKGGAFYSSVWGSAHLLHLCIERAGNEWERTDEVLLYLFGCTHANQFFFNHLIWSLAC
jgi:hypothetical protein